MIRPQPRSIMPGVSSLARRTTEKTLRSKLNLQSSEVTSVHGGLSERTFPPAELTRISMPPKAANATSATSLAPASSVSEPSATQVSTPNAAHSAATPTALSRLRP